MLRKSSHSVCGTTKIVKECLPVPQASPSGLRRLCARYWTLGRIRTLLRPISERRSRPAAAKPFTFEGALGRRNSHSRLSRQLLSHAFTRESCFHMF